MLAIDFRPDPITAAGVYPERLQFLPAAPSVAAHLETIGNVDLAFDSFPYQGTMTTLETLTMGVPVVTLQGETYCRRASSALLTRLGFNELVATNLDDYVEKTLDLVGAPARLERLRRTIRQRLLESEICDVGSYVVELEETYRRLWQSWCSRYPERHA